MEKYGTACRLILCCGGIGQIIEPIRSRCLTTLLLRVICLQWIAKAKSVTLPDIVANRLSVDRNAR
jgi:DNA polymerase III delta prime subunit